MSSPYAVHHKIELGDLSGEVVQVTDDSYSVRWDTGGLGGQVLAYSHEVHWEEDSTPVWTITVTYGGQPQEHPGLTGEQALAGLTAFLKDMLLLEGSAITKLSVSRAEAGA